MAENLLRWLRKLDELERRDIAHLMDCPLSSVPFKDRQSVIREMEEVPAAFATTLHKLKEEG